MTRLVIAFCERALDPIGQFGRERASLPQHLT
jgi:hypothetical protein